MFKNSKEQGIKVLEELNAAGNRKDEEIKSLQKKNAEAEITKRKLKEENSLKQEILKQLTSNDQEKNKLLIEIFKSANADIKEEIKFDLDKNFEGIFKDILRKNKIVLNFPKNLIFLPIRST